MENPAPDPTVVLKVNIGCCKACSRKLKKVLLTINGVNSVAIDREERLVFVTGKVDPMMLIKAVEEMGKKAELVSKKELKKDKNHAEDHHPNKSQTTRDNCLKKENVRQTGKHRDCCCQDNKSYKKENYGHKVKDYVAPTQEFDEEICRDPYCRIHRRNRIIHDHVPPSDRRPPMFWHHPGSEYSFHRANPPYPQWSREQPNPYEYYHPSMPPRPTYGGVRPGRPVPGSDNFSNFFSDENTRGCTIM